jgi:hypothetical protein
LAGGTVEVTLICTDSLSSCAPSLTVNVTVKLAPAWLAAGVKTNSPVEATRSALAGNSELE